MANDSTITFDCPACDIRLTVPGSLAGVSGPCPSCGNQIQAPSDSVGNPALAETSASVSPTTAVAAATVSEAVQTTADGMPDIPNPADPTTRRLETRQRPKHESNLERFSKTVSEGVGHDSRPSSVVRTKPTVSAGIVRILLPLVFILLIVAAVFAILTILSNRSGNAPFFDKLPFSAPAPVKP